MASIKDVARMAEVSVMTASRVINGAGTVSKENRRRVLSAVKRLGYRPNLTARSLRARRSNLLGLLIPDNVNPVFAAMAKYVEEEAHRFGYNVMLGDTWENPEREAKYLEIMLARQMDGLVIAPASDDNEKLIRDIEAPVVIIDRTLTGPGSPPSVTVDNLEVGRLAARHLLELGHRHVACVSGPLHVDVFRQRLDGFREVLDAAGVPLLGLLSLETTGEMENGARLGRELFRACRARPLAIFCHNDLTAFGVIQAAHRLGFAVPGEVSIVGVDDIPVAELVMPPLTTVRQPFPAIAAAGMAMLMRMLKNPADRPGSEVLRPELIIRESTRAYRDLM